jgi:hypothetical protein
MGGKRGTVTDCHHDVNLLPSPFIPLQLLLIKGVLAQQERIGTYRMMRGEQAAEALYSPRGILAAIRMDRARRWW